MHPPAIQEHEILERALAALPRIAGLHGRATEADPHRIACGDAHVEIQTAQRTYPFVAKIKNVRHFATIGLVKEQLACAKRGVQPVVGATARDLLLFHVFGIRITRATADTTLPSR